jgi:outer membrane protein TolC
MPVVLQIDFKDAIDRGLRNNLGLLLAGDQAQMARGQRWKELSELLPNIQARVQEDVQTQSLAALGFNKLFPLLAAPGSSSTSLPRLVPAFNYFDARASLSQSIFSFKNIERERAASENVKAAQFSYKDAREMVVLAVGNSYLQAIAAGARVETTEAQVKSAQALYGKAADQQKAGLTPAIAGRTSNPPAAVDRCPQRSR